MELTLYGCHGGAGWQVRTAEMDCGGHGAQAGDLEVSRQCKDLSFTISITLSVTGIMNQERGHQDPSLPCDLALWINSLLAPPASSSWEEPDHRI